jgi:uncharacterized membrane protein YhaH (DUF805 family)
MFIPELVTYVNRERTKGVSDDALLVEMVSRGWRKEDALLALGVPSANESLHTNNFFFRNFLSGRINRYQFFVCIAVSVLVFFAIAIAFGISENAMGNHAYQDTFTVPIGVLAVVMMLYWLSVFVRRLHDLGYSGYYVLFIFIPILGNFAIPFLILFFLAMEGQKGPNAFGAAPDPRRPISRVLCNL